MNESLLRPPKIIPAQLIDREFRIVVVCLVLLLASSLTYQLEALMIVWPIILVVFTTYYSKMIIKPIYTNSISEKLLLRIILYMSVLIAVALLGPVSYVSRLVQHIYGQYDGEVTCLFDFYCVSYSDDFLIWYFYLICILQIIGASLILYALNIRKMIPLQRNLVTHGILNNICLLGVAICAVIEGHPLYGDAYPMVKNAAIIYMLLWFVSSCFWFKEIRFIR